MLSTREKPMAPNSPVNARLVVVEQIYFQSHNNDPVPLERRFVRQLKTDEQPYSRIIKVGKEWQQLDCGWIDKCSMLHIENIYPQWSVNPTPEERKEVDERIVELAICREDAPSGSIVVGDWDIPCGETFRGTPRFLDRLYLRCPTGEARCKVTLFPA